MSKCEKCLSHNVCKWWANGDGHNLNCTDEVVCPEYKSKSLCVELPCEVGITLYFLYNRPYADTPDLTPKIYETNEWYFEIDEKEIAICPRMIHGLSGNYYYHLGKTVFVDREEAEKKLKEMG